MEILTHETKSGVMAIDSSRMTRVGKYSPCKLKRELQLREKVIEVFYEYWIRCPHRGIIYSFPTEIFIVILVVRFPPIPTKS